MCSKHVEARNKLIVKQKFCASSWLITEINKLRCTVSKTSENGRDELHNTLGVTWCHPVHPVPIPLSTVLLISSKVCDGGE